MISLQLPQSPVWKNWHGLPQSLEQSCAPPHPSHCSLGAAPLQLKYLPLDAVDLCISLRVTLAESTRSNSCSSLSSLPSCTFVYRRARSLDCQSSVCPPRTRGKKGWHRPLCCNSCSASSDSLHEANWVICFW